MRNLDSFNAEKELLLSNISNAVSANDADAMKASLEAWNNFMVEECKATMADFEATSDKNILAARGVRQLTAEETKYYEEFIKSAKASAADGVITKLPANLPQTVITSVLDDIKTSHPLLGLIDFQATSAAIKWVFNDQATQSATWDDVNTAITTAVGGAIETLDLTMCKLTAYMYCTEDMLDLGPAWVDSYVRATLGEALANGLEQGIVDGSAIYTPSGGSAKKCPIGMTRNFTGSLNNSTGYARKQAVAISDFGVGTYATILDTLSKTRLGNPRNVDSVILVVNPTDYFTKVMPATSAIAVDGRSYVNDLFPFPTTVVRSSAVPANHAVMGIAKNYKMFLGTSKGGKLETSDEYKWLEDLRTYKIKLYGNGRPLDINSFVYLDITNVTADIPKVKTITAVSGSVETTTK